MTMAAAWLAGAAAARAETTAPEGLTAVTVAQVRAYVAASGGTVEKVEDTDDGAFEMKAVYPGKAPVYIEGFECRGVGEEKRCRELQLYAYFLFDTEAEARAKEHEVDVLWLSDLQIGHELKIWRYEVVYGATATHLQDVFATFLSALWAAYDIIYPKSPDAGDAAA